VGGGAQVIIKSAGLESLLPRSDLVATLFAPTNEVRIPRFPL
jgi:hypothetical protein